MGSSSLPPAAASVEWLTGGGEMGELIATLDWADTPLGPLASWPQSLRTTVSLCLASNFPINIIWGEQHNQIYNDGYRAICGAVHPRAMGEDYRVTWASAWPAIGRPFERALAGHTSFLENQRMFLERNGYPEETFFTFSLSPIRDESGAVVGLFHPVTETTATILAARRTQALRDVADRAGQAMDIATACALLIETIGASELDIPFALLYLTNADGTRAELTGRVGIVASAEAARASLVVGEESAWPCSASGEDRLRVLTDVGERFAPFAAGPYPDPISSAFVLTLRAPGVGLPLGILVAGASPRLPLDDAYRTFAEMLGAASATALGNARAHAAERARTEALAQLDRAKTTFFSNVSHEFRTPLTLLLGPLEDLLARHDTSLSDHVREELQVVRRNGLRLLKLVNSLLEFSRVEAGRTSASFTATDLGTLTADLASSFRSAFERAGIRFSVELGELPPAVQVDRDMWEKIVLNLLSNAFKFTKQGEVSVRLRAEGGHVSLSVSDTGVGIPGTELGRVFQRFHRVQGMGGRTHEGSGIGLALVSDLAALHGGSARVESAPGIGSTFTVTIPVDQEPGSVREPIPAPAAKHSSSPMTSAFVEEAIRWLPDDAPSADGPAPPAASDARPRVLLADDNADMRDYVRRLLAPTYDVIAVANGREALEAASRQPPDLVLSDVMMPEMDGAELVRRLRTDERLGAVPVILLSARAGEEATTEGLELGADDYLTKPFAATELLARVASHIKLTKLRQLQQSVEARDEFLAIASHELRTPLTSLSFQVERLERALTGERVLTTDRQAKAVRVVAKQAQRMRDLVEDLLDVGRIRSGQLHLNPARVDLVALASDVIERLSSQLAKAECELTLAAPPTLMGTWDAARIEQVLTNLLDNATTYAPHGPLSLTLWVDGDDARVELRDSGPGISAEQRASIFDRFDRAGASRNRGGLGLGLVIAKQIVRAHGGRIVAEAPEGRGARFVIWLPLSASSRPPPTGRPHPRVGA